MGSHSRDKGKEREGDRHSESKHRHKSRDGTDTERRSSNSTGEKRDRDRERRSSKKRSSKTGSGTRIVDDDVDDEDEMWVEKPAEEPEEPASIANIPTRQSLALTSTALPSSHASPPLPHSVIAESLPREKRDEWMLSDQVALSRQAPIRQSDNLHNGGTFSVGTIPTGVAKPSKFDTVDQFTDGYGEGDVGTKGTFGGDLSTGGKGGSGVDFFSSLGQERKKKEPPAAKKANPDAPKMSSREINTAIYAADGSRLPSSVEAMKGGALSSTSNTASEGSRPPLPGSSGSSWRMMKIKRAYEAAEDEGRDVDEVGVERFGSVEAWEAAKEEKRVLEDRETARHRGQSGRGGHHSGRPGYDRSSTGTPDPTGARRPAAEEDSNLDEFGRERRPAADTNAPAKRTGPVTSNGPPSGVAGRYVFHDSNSAPTSRPPSRAGSFRRPGSSADEGAGQNSRPSTPAPPGSTRERMEQRASGNSKPSTPIPSVFTPPPSAALRKPSQLQTSTTAEQATKEGIIDSQNDVSKPPMSPTSLNRLQAKVLRMRLMGTDAQELKELEEQYERESKRSRQGDAGEGYFDSKDIGKEHGAADDNTEIRVLPTLDGRGRLYDVGRAGQSGEGDDDRPLGPGNKRKRKEKYFETRDTATGELLRYNPDDDTTTLEEMVRQERFGGGAADQKNLDAEVASRIATDAKFEDDLEYMDDTADRLARKKIRTEAQKKMFAVNDFAKTKKALDSCQFCYQDTDTTTVPPQAAMVALGTRTYLALPLFEPLVDGHALIVPIQHHLCMLEADDDTWDETKNFMKTLMQMHAEQDKGVFFYETVISFRGQRHTYIEAVPVPWALFEELPAYFREGILTSEAEWSQHKKLIDFSARPGGFRRAMVPNLPYFMVQWDYKGEKGFGHVIEGAETATGSEADGNYDFDEGAKGGGEFSRFFAAEIIGNLVDANPRLWRKPRRMDRRQNEERVQAFRKHYDKFDWTKLLAS